MLWSPEEGFSPKQVPVGEPGKVPVQLHLPWFGHKVSKVLALERQCLPPPVTVCMGGLLSEALPRSSAWNPSVRVTFSTSWMCSCRSASVTLSTYHLSTLMRSLEHGETGERGATALTASARPQAQPLFSSRGHVFFL